MDKIRVTELSAKGGIATSRRELPDDLFIVGASFEPRTLITANNLASSYHAKKGIIYYNGEFLGELSGKKLDKNISILKNRMEEKCDETTVVEGSWLDAQKQFRSMNDALANLQKSEGNFVTVDMTTFNREALIVLAALLLNCHSHLRVLYVSPVTHGKWLSRGFRIVRNVMGFPGIQRPSLRTLLVVMSGFEPDRVLKLVDGHEPAKILLGIGNPPTTPRFLRRNVLEQKVILSQEDVEPFYFSAENIGDCVHELDALVTAHVAGYNIILAPMSTKLSTMAALLVAFRRPEVQLSYCVPGEYNVKNYSRGSDCLFIETVS